jgi:hypothetical protein
MVSFVGVKEVQQFHCLLLTNNDAMMEGRNGRFWSVLVGIGRVLVGIGRVLVGIGRVLVGIGRYWSACLLGCVKDGK